MSLSRSLLNGNFGVDMTLINPAKYTADCGAHVIAMESVAELHEIFLEDYNYEQADLAAISEGVELEGSRYEAVAEASIQGAFDKIKAFFKKLWAKIKEFFHNIARYFDAVFKSGKDFINKYKADIDAITEVNDLVMSLHNYDDNKINKFEKDMSSIADSIKDEVTDAKALIDRLAKNAVSDDAVNEYKKIRSAETFYKTYTKNHADDLEGYKKFIRQGFYNNGRDDTSEVTVSTSTVSDVVSALTSANKPNYSNLESKINTCFSSAINVINSAQAEVKKGAANEARLKDVLSTLSSYFSIHQNALTASVTIHKDIWGKRDAEYKHIIVSALSHSKKKK